MLSKCPKCPTNWSENIIVAESSRVLFSFSTSSFYFAYTSENEKPPLETSVEKWEKLEWTESKFSAEFQGTSCSFYICVREFHSWSDCEKIKMMENFWKNDGDEGEYLKNRELLKCAIGHALSRVYRNGRLRAEIKMIDLISNQTHLSIWLTSQTSSRAAHVFYWLIALLSSAGYI